MLCTSGSRNLGDTLSSFSLNLEYMILIKEDSLLDLFYNVYCFLNLERVCALSRGLRFATHYVIVLAFQESLKDFTISARSKDCAWRQIMDLDIQFRTVKGRDLQYTTRKHC